VHKARPPLRRQHFLADRFAARRVSQVETVDLEPIAPLAEIQLASVAGCRVARKARSDDESRSRAEKLEPRLVTDLYPATCEQRDVATQVRELRAFREILLCAGDAETVVEMVDRRELLLADVTLPRLFSFERWLSAGEELARFGRIDVRRGDEDRLAPQFPDAGCREDALFALHFLGSLFPLDDLQELAAAERVGA